MKLLIEIQGDREDERSRQSWTRSLVSLALWEPTRKEVADQFRSHLEVWGDSVGRSFSFGSK